MFMEQTRRGSEDECSIGIRPYVAAGSRRDAVGIRRAMKVSKVALTASTGLSPPLSLARRGLPKSPLQIGGSVTGLGRTVAGDSVADGVRHPGRSRNITTARHGLNCLLRTEAARLS